MATGELEEIGSRKAIARRLGGLLALSEGVGGKDKGIDRA
jgi:hypothetical protein